MKSLKLPELYKINEINISYRNKIPPNERPDIKQASTAYATFRQSWDDNKIEMVEQFKIMLLDRRSRCLGIAEISSGGWNSCIADKRIIFSTALKGRANGILLAHNHPSHNKEPSEEDIRVTQELIEIGELLEIPVLDHLIITPNTFYSMANEGLIP